MFDLLIRVIPLDIAVLIGAPGILALTLFLLGVKNHPKLKVLGFLIGSLIVGIAIALLGLYFGDLTPKGPHQTLASAIVDTAFGTLFAIYGIYVLFPKDRKLKPSKDTKSHFFRWILLGLLISATNFDSVLFSLAATKEVSGSNLDLLTELILTFVNICFFIMPIGLPLLLYMLTPAFAERVLSKANRVVLKYSRYILALVFIVFAYMLLSRGLGYFLG
ncbi:MAG: GAP family protein [Patescibacteria group bacterium]|jgi:threonine/homoserine/homoserine lactone efflux protein